MSRSAKRIMTDYMKPCNTKQMKFRVIGDTLVKESTAMWLHITPTPDEQKSSPKWLMKVPEAGWSRRGRDRPASSLVLSSSRVKRTTSPSAARMASPCHQKPSRWSKLGHLLCSIYCLSRTNNVHFLMLRKLPWFSIILHQTHSH